MLWEQNGAEAFQQRVATCHLCPTGTTQPQPEVQRLPALSDIFTARCIRPILRGKLTGMALQNNCFDIYIYLYINWQTREIHTNSIQ